MVSPLKLKTKESYNVVTKEYGYTTTVAAGEQLDTQSLIERASRNTTMNKAELRLAVELTVETMVEEIMQGHRVELEGIGSFCFACSGPWTKTPEEQTLQEHKISLKFYPSKKLKSAVAQAQTVWSDEDK